MTNAWNSPWNNHTEDLLRQWWEKDGHSCGRIATEFAKTGYKVTRNSIIGKVHRLKLTAPEWKNEKQRDLSRQRMKVARAIRPKQEHILIMGKKFNTTKAPAIVVSLTHSPPSGKSMVLLKHSKEGECKAIIGYAGGKAENAVYCGEKTELIPDRNGRKVYTPWCPYHRSIYITESKPSKSQYHHRGVKR